MKKMSTQMIVEAGVMLALAMVLQYIKIYELPNGGSVTAGSMVPIVFFALRWGTKKGVFVGIVFGVLQFILGKQWSLNPISILLDYFVAFGFLGLAGMFRNSKAGTFIGTFIAIAGRFLAHLISGATVFACYAPKGQNPWIYSFIYNISYMLPELVITMVIIVLLYKPLSRVLNRVEAK